MTDFKISELGSRSTPGSTDDMIINDNSDSANPETKKTSVAALASAISLLIGGGGGDGGDGGGGIPGGTTSFAPQFKSFGAGQSYSRSPSTGSLTTGATLSSATATFSPPPGTNGCLVYFFSSTTLNLVSYGWSTGTYVNPNAILGWELSTNTGDFEGSGDSQYSTGVTPQLMYAYNNTALRTLRSDIRQASKFDLLTYPADTASITFTSTIKLTRVQNAQLSIGSGRLVIIPLGGVTTEAVKDWRANWALLDEIFQQNYEVPTQTQVSEEDQVAMRTSIQNQLRICDVELNSVDPQSGDYANLLLAKNRFVALKTKGTYTQEDYLQEFIDAGIYLESLLQNIYSIDFT